MVIRKTDLSPQLRIGGSEWIRKTINAILYVPITGYR